MCEAPCFYRSTDDIDLRENPVGFLATTDPAPLKSSLSPGCALFAGFFLQIDLAPQASAQQHGQPVFDFGSAGEIAVFRRKLQRVAQRRSARNDRHLVDRVRAGRQLGHQGMAGFMISDDLSFPARKSCASCARARRSRVRWLLRAPAVPHMVCCPGPPEEPLH